MCKIAIILPTYKPSSYLSLCLDSINNQELDYSQYCVYIGLNGSSEEYDRFVRRSLKNVNFNYKYFNFDFSGVSRTRNKLLENSVEEYIVFIDDDDVISVSYLKNLLEKSSEDTMGIANVVSFRNNDIRNTFTHYIGRSFLKLEHKGESHFLYRKYFSSPWAKMLHRSMINDIKFDINLDNGEDGLFMATISKNIKYISKCDENTIYHVNYRTSSASRKKVNKKHEIIRLSYLMKMYLQMLVKYDYSSTFIITRMFATLAHFKRLI